MEITNETPAQPEPAEISADALIARLKPLLETETGRGNVTVSRYLTARSKASSGVGGATALMVVPRPVDDSGFFELKNVVALGGMGAILSAEDKNILRTVAIKVMLPGAALSEEKVQRFVTEARITGQLEHPNIVPLYEMGVAADGTLFYSMRLIGGHTLSQILTDIRNNDADIVAKYPLGQLLTLFQKVCDGVAYAHSRGVIHRDLKPDNIMVGDYGEVLVMDWGLAKLLPMSLARPSVRQAAAMLPSELAGRDSFRTLDGQVKGTPRYMAPEQAEARSDSIDVQTDIYALGAILYTILTLHPPVTGDDVREVLENVAAGRIVPPTTFNTRTSVQDREALKAFGDIIPPLVHCPDRRVPAALSAVTMKAMARQPENRYQTVAELQRDISSFQGGRATIAEKATTLTLMLLMLKRRRTEFTLIGIAALLLLSLGVAAFINVTNTLAELRATAPSIYAEARLLVGELKFARAEQKISYAISLDPREADYYAFRGQIYQSMMRFRDAREDFARALQLSPAHPHARENRDLCDKILNTEKGKDSLSPESFIELMRALRNQGRDAEVTALTPRQSKDSQQIFDSWKVLLQKAGLHGQLTRDPDGLLQLNLENSKVSDISLLSGMPLSSLNLARNAAVTNIAPLRGMPLAYLDLSGTRVQDLVPITRAPIFELNLSNNRRILDLNPLQTGPLTKLDLSGTSVSDLRPLRELQLTSLNLQRTPVSDLGPLRGMPLTLLLLDSTPALANVPAVRGSKTRPPSGEATTPLVDLAPLADCKRLEFLTLPPRFINIEALRDLPGLKRIGRELNSNNWDKVTSAEDFWKDWDAKNGKQ